MHFSKILTIFTIGISAAAATGRFQDDRNHLAATGRHHGREGDPSTDGQDTTGDSGDTDDTASSSRRGKTHRLAARSPACRQRGGHRHGREGDPSTDGQDTTGDSGDTDDTASSRRRGGR
ncbi:hypothetical protein MCOR27_001678 [Pyricularia oryzae]|uniref:Uncharacterized protein n=2 Tax=Pyricularia TaxID=48558 RepID=A0ABQ8NWT5_PYRGI|nr:hypothetical protein MCOR02_001384 [Pyricularia oryzae]KAI6303272.1 hypothetical protein MCOR33_001535 [Pyricularia grisea]KAI6256109.1 hypothetical protein MCOR19_007385 [Pyricularia oryzae]KAI6285168.1 hypothetical protein MCOR26_001654 [Pyricularia oryzae]KAI6286763.1 hypothetical protein MCOR27_001678 [Pyricularia oryzae]